MKFPPSVLLPQIEQIVIACIDKNEKNVEMICSNILQ